MMIGGLNNIPDYWKSDELLEFILIMQQDSDEAKRQLITLVDVGEVETAIKYWHAITYAKVNEKARMSWTKDTIFAALIKSFYINHKESVQKIATQIGAWNQELWLFLFLTGSSEVVFNSIAASDEAYLFYDNRNIIRFNSADENICKQQAREFFDTILKTKNEHIKELRTKYQSVQEELTYLRWFYSEADFGLADGDVRLLMNRSYVENGGVIPEGYGEEE